MRLINAETRQFEIFNDERKLPPYAILSHRWVDGQEILYKDFLKGRNQDLSGYDKIDRCCLQALKDGISYVWVDTCCIDKKSSAELSEAINSMFRWYGLAQVCYAYLNDVSMDDSVSIELTLELWLPKVYWAGINATNNGSDQLGIWLLVDARTRNSYRRVKIPRKWLVPDHPLGYSEWVVARRQAQIRSRIMHINIVTEAALPAQIPVLSHSPLTMPDWNLYVNWWGNHTAMNYKHREFGWPSFASLYIKTVPGLSWLDVSTIANPSFSSHYSLSEGTYGFFPLFGKKDASYIRSCFGIFVDLFFEDLSSPAHWTAMSIGFDTLACPVLLLAEAVLFSKCDMNLSIDEIRDKRLKHSHNRSLSKKSFWGCDGLEEEGWLEPSDETLKPLKSMKKGFWALKATRRPVSRFVFRPIGRPDRLVEILVEQPKQDQTLFEISFVENVK